MSAVGSQIQPAAGPSKGLVSKVGSIFRKKQPNRALDATKAVIPLGKRWTTTEFRVEQGEADMRLDRLITSKYEISRPLLQKLLRKRLVQLERPDYVSNPGQLAEPHQIISIPVSCSARVQEGDVISLSEVFLKEKQGSLNTICYEDLTPKKLEKLREMVIFKDENILVLNKPAGLATHNGPGLKTDEHLEGLLEGLKFELEETPRLVHRLDKDTSGVLLLARTRKAAADLASRFQQSQLDRRVQKYVIITTQYSGEVVFINHFF